MFKLNENTYRNLDHGIQAAFGAGSSSMIHYHKPDVLAAANSAKVAMDVAAPMPAPAVETPRVAFGPVAA